MMKLTPLSRAAATAAAALGLCLLALPCAAFAAGAQSTGAGEHTAINLKSSSTGTPTVSTGGASLVRTIVGLAIVIGVIWGLSWILRQVKSGKEPQTSSTGLASVAALPIAAGRSVHLVRAGNDYVLLGSGEHGLVPIHRYTQEQAREAGLTVLDEPAPLAGPRSPAVPLNAGQKRHDPMQMPAPGSGVIERVREWTVRR
jgi:flagellar protein FliO/FliZ